MNQEQRSNLIEKNKNIVKRIFEIDQKIERLQEVRKDLHQNYWKNKQLLEGQVQPVQPKETVVPSRIEQEIIAQISTDPYA